MTNAPALVPGAPEASELVRRRRGQARPRMPHDGPPFFDDEDIALIVAWVQQGARDAQGIPAVLPAGSKVRLHGTLEPNWTLDGLPLQLSPATRIVFERPAAWRRRASTRPYPA